MRDIGDALRITMQKQQCSSLSALLLLKEEKKDDIRILQSQPTKKTGRRLRDKSNF